MWTVAIYYGVLLLTLAVAMYRGGRLERWAAYTALLASVFTTIMAPAPKWTDIEINIFVIDLLALASFWVIALKTRLAIDRDFRASPEVHVFGDIGASLCAAFNVYFLSDPVRHFIRIGIGTSEG
jgi:hypothetical protein